MKMIFLILALILGFSTNGWAAVQTDTHIYILGDEDDKVLTINRQTGQETRIPVGINPRVMLIHGNKGYVVNFGSDNVSVIDLKTSTVTQTITVGHRPQSMVIYGDSGYVANEESQNVSVINLQTNTVIKTIPVGHSPQSMVIHGGMGYVVNYGSNTVSVLDLKSNTVTQTISVGETPQSMVIHGEKGYVVNSDSYDVSVIDLQTNTVIQTIPVGENPHSMVIHGDIGYVVNYYSNDVSVIDLTSNTVIQAIPVREHPQSMVIHGDRGYVAHWNLNSISVIDLKRNAVTQTVSLGKQLLCIKIYGGMGYVMEKSPFFTVIDLQTSLVITRFENPKYKDVNFSDTHVYLGLEKARPHYPTLASINRAKEQKTLGEFVAMMPEVFQLGEVEKRKFPKEMNEFDTLPPYVLAQEFFWDLKTDKPLMDPKDILATLVTMKYPQKFLKGDLGVWLRKRLHMAFFQAVWLGDKGKTKAMLTYFVQLQDPVITKLATYTFKDAKESSDQKATNSTDLS